MPDPRRTEEKRLWPWGPLFPVFIELKKLAESDAFPREGEPGSEEDLLDYLERHAGLGADGPLDLTRPRWPPPGS